MVAAMGAYLVHGHKFGIGLGCGNLKLEKNVLLLMEEDTG